MLNKLIQKGKLSTKHAYFLPLNFFSRNIGREVGVNKIKNVLNQIDLNRVFGKNHNQKLRRINQQQQQQRVHIREP